MLQEVPLKNKEYHLRVMFAYLVVMVVLDGMISTLTFRPMKHIYIGIGSDTKKVI